MSSHKQLWLAATITMVVLFLVTSGLSTLSNQNYLQQQLNREGINNAGLIASSLEQQNQRESLLDVRLPAQFDASAYQLVQITDFAGAITAMPGDANIQLGVPAWFASLFPIAVEPRIVPIMNGATERGFVTLLANALPAQRTLWQQCIQLAALFLVALLAVGSLASLFLNRLLRPLDQLVDQAEALTGGNFVAVEESIASEFQPAARAMNNLSRSIPAQLARMSTKPAPIKQDNGIDTITGLMNRGQFIDTLKNELERSKGHGVVSLIHLNNLQDINRSHGRRALDELLTAMGRALSQRCRQNSDWHAGRLNGSDFALFSVGETNPMWIAKEAQAALREVLKSHAMANQLQLPAATTALTPDDTIKDLFTRLDSALAAAIAEQSSNVYLAERGYITVMPAREQLIKWREIFSEAFTELNFSLASFPVAGLEGELLHVESPARLQWHDENMTASEFLPWIHRLELAGELDKQVVELALLKIETLGQPVCVNLSAAAVSDPRFLIWLSEKLLSQGGAAGKLWLEIAEATAYSYLTEFTRLAFKVRSLGCKIGIEHMGHRLADIGRLRGVELDYMKIDGTFIRSIDQNRANQTIVRTLCSIGKSTGVMSIAEGVANDAEWNMLKALGIDGVTGPGVTISHDGNGSSPSERDPHGTAS
ncbi:MAG: diguanylate cyclase (GGDEF)-like protein [Halioglobus sp.]|jgi:diguanylate cyclase (GGDEF)-like protein